MNVEVSAKEELEKINAEIYRLERCKKVLEDTLAFELPKRQRTALVVTYGNQKAVVSGFFSDCWAFGHGQWCYGEFCGDVHGWFGSGTSRLYILA